MNDLNRFIRATREQKGLSIRKLAELSNVSANFIRFLEIGRSPTANENVLTAIAKALEVDVNYMLALGGKYPDALRQEWIEEVLHGKAND